jgi:hypothetical protein
MAEVFESLLRLGLGACPVCGSTESLSMSPYPAILVDGEFPLDPDALPEQDGGDLTFAVRVECTTCGHLMLFNAQRYRTGDAKIIEYEITEDGMTEEGRPLQERNLGWNHASVRDIYGSLWRYTGVVGAGCASMTRREVRRARR